MNIKETSPLRCASRAGIKVPRLNCTPNLNHNGEVIMDITTVGVDLAKEVITVCTMDRSGSVLKTMEKIRERSSRTIMKNRVQFTAT